MEKPYKRCPPPLVGLFCVRAKLCIINAMSEQNFDFLDTLRPAADPRRIASELGQVYFFMQCSRGLVSEEFEAFYEQPSPDQYPYDEGRRIVGDFLGWYVTHPLYGLIGRTNFVEATNAIGALGSLLTRPEILQVADILPVQTQLQRAYNASYGISSETYEDNYTVDMALHICKDLTDEEPDGVKSALTRDMSDPVYRKLGESLRLA